MGGYALYVWPSFLIAGLVLAAMVGQSLCALRKARDTLTRLQPIAEPAEGQ